MSPRSEHSSDPHSPDERRAAEHSNAEPASSERERALASREAAVADREAAIDDREESVDARESQADARDGVSADRAYEVRRTVAAAEGRDDAADERDRDAETRDRAANLDAFVNGIVDPRQVRERQRAGADRTHSQADRLASGVDRSTLTDSDPDVSGINLRDHTAEPPEDDSPRTHPG